LPISARDGSLADVAKELFASLDGSRRRASDAIAELARRAAGEESVTATERLDDDLRLASAAGALVRSAEGTHLLVVAQTRSRLVVVAAPVEARGPFRTESRPAWRACVEAPIAGGVCEASAP
jgi:hypothetical protein